jgi:hypothetical protein
VLNLEPIFQFSRQNCVAICSFLVPANLVATLSTLILVGLQRPLVQVKLSVTMATLLAGVLFLHVATWFIIGVITPVTFILAGLGTTCLLVNLVAVVYRQELSYLLSKINVLLKSYTSKSF